MNFFKTIYYYTQRYWLKLILRREKQIFIKKIKGLTYKCNNKWAYLSALKEIYLEGCYQISPRVEINSVLDIGANFGFSVGYFKMCYPQAKVLAFEADKDIFKFLEENIKVNNLQNVELVQGAAWVKNEELTFFQDFSQGGSLNKMPHHLSEIRVPA